MADSTLAALTAATAGTGGLYYGTQAGADRKFTMTAAGAVLAEAANAAAQVTALGVLPITGGALTGAVAVPVAAGYTLANARANGFVIGASLAAADVGFSSAAGELNIFVNGQPSVFHNIVSFRFDSNIWLGWATAGPLGGPITELSGALAANTLQIGKTHATTPTSQTIKSHDVTTGTGADLILSGGSGSVANGNVIISKLPTSNPGPGILWNNAGTPAIGT